MQYLVQVSGDISDKQNRTYVVNSDSAENAQIIATQNFCEEFSSNGDVVCVESHKRTNKAILAFAFMLIPILLSFINWKSGHETISIGPDYISCLYGVLIYAAFIVRFKGIQRTVSSWVDILFCIFVVLLISSFIKTIFITKTFSFLGLSSFSIETSYILPIAIILSWLGLKIVSLICMGGIAVIALFNITSLNGAMGIICGPLYIICSFIGIMLYLSIEPAFIESIYQLKATTSKGINYVKKDVLQAKSNIVDVKTELSKKDS